MEKSYTNIFDKFSLIGGIFPYYHYADKTVKVLKQIGKDSHDTLTNNFDAIVYTLPKRVGIIRNQFKGELIQVLLKNQKYKLFEFEIILLYKSNYQIFYDFIDEHDDIILKSVKMTVRTLNFKLFKQIYK